MLYLGQGKHKILDSRTPILLPQRLNLVQIQRTAPTGSCKAEAEDFAKELGMDEIMRHTSILTYHEQCKLMHEQNDQAVASWNQTLVPLCCTRRLWASSTPPCNAFGRQDYKLQLHHPPRYKAMNSKKLILAFADAVDPFTYEVNIHVHQMIQFNADRGSTVDVDWSQRFNG